MENKYSDIILVIKILKFQNVKAQYHLFISIIFLLLNNSLLKIILR